MDFDEWFIQGCWINDAYDEDCLDNLPEDLSNQSDYVKKIQKHLRDGGDIDCVINKDNDYDNPPSTILQRCVVSGFTKIVEFALKKGANVTKKLQLDDSDVDDYKYAYRHWNALEIAVLKMNPLHPTDFSPSARRNRIFKMIWNKCSADYSSHGLCRAHVECAFGVWSEICEHLTPDNINKAIAADSPLWPSMTPLLIAAKFDRNDIIDRLLSLGANHHWADNDGNTALHYLSTYGYCDKRLFVFDNFATFGRLNGMSHFHIACVFCPFALDIVKLYLDLGVSPDSRVRNSEYSSRNSSSVEGTTGLHLAAKTGDYKTCAELAKLLLEYGAQVECADEYELTPLQRFRFLNNDDLAKDADYVNVLVANGADPEGKMLTVLLESIGACPEFTSVKTSLLRCICSLSLLSKNLLADNLNVMADDFAKSDENFVKRCKEELRSLSELGLLSELDDTTVVKSDFKRKLADINLNRHKSRCIPIYASTVEIKLKRRLLEFEKKRMKVWEAVPYVVFVTKAYCGNLPPICAEQILWNFTMAQLNEFCEDFHKAIIIA